MEKQMLTVKEWAAKSGLELHNYDGFLRTYAKLSGANTDNLLDYSTARFRDAGDIVCSREAFEAGLSECTITMPRMEELETISEVLPHYVENFI